MLIDGTDPFADARLIKLLLKARRFNATLVGNDGVPFAALAEREGVSRSYFTRIVRLRLPQHAGLTQRSNPGTTNFFCDEIDSARCR
jgi:hypothetical protein